MSFHEQRNPYFAPPAMQYVARLNPGLDFGSIREGDRVTIVNRFGQESTGTARMPSSNGGWVLDMGGRYGTPGIAMPDNTIRVKHKGRRGGGYGSISSPTRSNPGVRCARCGMVDCGCGCEGDPRYCTCQVAGNPHWLGPREPGGYHGAGRRFDPGPSLKEEIRAYVSRLGGDEIDALGVSREIGRPQSATAVEHALNDLVLEGVLRRGGNWYSLARNPGRDWHWGGSHKFKKKVYRGGGRHHHHGGDPGVWHKGGGSRWHGEWHPGGGHFEKNPGEKPSGPGWSCEVCGDPAVVVTQDLRYLCRDPNCAWAPYKGTKRNPHRRPMPGQWHPDFEDEDYDEGIPSSMDYLGDYELNPGYGYRSNPADDYGRWYRPPYIGSNPGCVENDDDGLDCYFTNPHDGYEPNPPRQGKFFSHTRGPRPWARGSLPRSLETSRQHGGRMRGMLKGYARSDFDRGLRDSTIEGMLGRSPADLRSEGRPELARIKSRADGVFYPTTRKLGMLPGTKVPKSQRAKPKKAAKKKAAKKKAAKAAPAKAAANPGKKKRAYKIPAKKDRCTAKTKKGTCKGRRLAPGDQCALHKNGIARGGKTAKKNPRKK